MKHFLCCAFTLLCLGLWSGCGQRVSERPDDTDHADSPAVDTKSEKEAPGGIDAQSSGENEAATPQNRPIRTQADLSRAIKAANPEMTTEAIMSPYGPGMIAVDIHDPKVTDISPLKGMRIVRLDLSGCDVKDLNPLSGMPLMELYLEHNTRLYDLSPLLGMPLRKLYVSDTKVENLGPLRRAPLVELNAIETRVHDLSPLSESPLQMLWLTGCPVKDISPLRSTPLVSLTIENTDVEDLSPLAGHPIQRLHIAGTKVTDLTPLGQMQLTRLIFTPSRIEKGIEKAREMASLREIDITFEGQPMSPSEFWPRYDAGEFN